MENMICNKSENIDLLTHYICKPVYIKGYCWNRVFDGWTVIYRREDGNLAFDYRGASYSVEGFLPSRFTMSTSSTYNNAFYNEQINA